MTAAILFSSLVFGTEKKSGAESRTVVVEFVVGPDGKPTKIRVVEAADKKLAESVVAAVSKWQLDKKYAGKRMRQPVEFQLDDELSKEKKG